jgi:hypothetical protein
MTINNRAVLCGDRKGILIAVLCFVHCVAGPLLLSFAGLSSLLGVSEKVEPVFALASIAIGTATLLPGYRKTHGKVSCLALFFCGLVFLLVLRRLEWLIVPEKVVAGIGAAMIAGAHILNLKFSRQCQCCRDGVDATLPSTMS